MNIPYSLTSFGYGEGHDEKVLSGMSEFKNGDFYYIKGNEYVDQTFLEALGKLMSVLTKNVTISVLASEKVDLIDVSGSGWVESTNTKVK